MIGLWEVKYSFLNDYLAETDLAEIQFEFLLNLFNFNELELNIRRTTFLR